MKRLKLNKLNILLCIVGIFCILFTFNITYEKVHALDIDNLIENNQVIEFDIAKGAITLTDTTYTGYNSGGTKITGTHVSTNVYLISQSNPGTSTSNGITIENENNNYVIVLNGVNIRRGSHSNQYTALSVNPIGTAEVHIILKDGTKNYLYSGRNRAGLEKEGLSTGLLLLTCEAGYNEWLNNPNAGHNDSSNYNESLCATSGCGHIDARSGNAWTSKGSANTYYGGAGIGTKGYSNGGSNIEGQMAGSNALDNLTIAGGNILALGGRGQGADDSSGGGANIGTGSASTSSSISGTVTRFKITGGNFDLLRGDNSAACIGGGYRSGYVNMEIYGGTISTSDNIDENRGSSTPTDYKSTLSNTGRARAACIGGGGGGTSSASPAGATVKIYGGRISATNRYGAAIGAGAGGSTGSATAAKVYISGGHITAETTIGDGKGAGAGIGTGGSLGTGSGGKATVVISGGTIFAKSENGADIGGGGTNSNTTGVGGVGIVTITGGNIKALTGGIGGGKAKAGAGGSATVTISGGTINATAIGGGNSTSGKGGDATVTVSGTANVTLTNGIGGGVSSAKDGGDATVTVEGGSLVCGSVIGGGNSAKTNGGDATVKVTGGYLKSYSIGGGSGGTAANASGGKADIDISGGTIITGTIGGGNTSSATGSIGFAKALITGGDITGQFIMAKGANEPCTFNMSGGTLHGLDTATTSFPYKNGGSVYMDDPNGKAVLSGGTITGGSAILGGAVYMTAGSFTVSDNGIIKGNKATENGGAIYLGKTGEYKGTFTMNGGTIESNTATQLGGAIYLDGGDAFVNGGEIKTNTAVDGGGTYLSGGTLTVTGGSIIENEASTNGGGAYLAGGTLTINGGSIYGNTAKNGAGAYLAGGTLTASGGSISSNSASINGGGAYLAGGELIVSGGDIKSNKATDGAGAYLNAGALKMSNGNISSNIASENGGGAYLAGGELIISGGYIDENEATDGAGAYLNAGALKMSDGNISSNIASENGGGAYLAGGTLTITGGSISSNTASNGGGAYLAGGTLDISGGNISSNEATNGGGAYLAGGTLDISGGNISSNTASNGGGAYVNNGTINMSNGNIASNKAGNGGGAYVSDGALNISGGTISSNNATNGGGAYVSGGDITMEGGSFTSNVATSSGGGAYISGGNLKVTSGSFDKNIAEVDGGGAYLVGGNFDLVGKNATFTSNSATNGGGVYLTGGKPNLYEGSIKGNFATSNGAGIYIDEQNVVLSPKSKVEIINNYAGYDKNGNLAPGEANGNGGAIYISGTNGRDASFSVDPACEGTVIISNNTAKTNGGGICINNGYFDMNSTKATVTSNTAENGGGVAVLAGDFNISDGSIGAEGSPNTAENGGGVYVSGGNVLITSKGAITYNVANLNGGGVCVSNGNVTMIGGTVGSNKSSTGAGGGIYASAENQDVTVEILSGNITNNSANTSGGAFAVVGRSGGTENITVTLGVNEAHLDANGNRIECKHGKDEIYTTTCPIITFNTASTSGGAIYITGGKSTKLNLYCLEENNNKSEDGESRSNFMMVEGGTVLISTVEGQNPENEDVDGLCTINNSIHVTAGAMDLYGSMSNPKIDSPITVDITSTEDHYRDHRTDDGTYYKLQYYENFKNTDGVTTGQYTVYQIKNGTEHTISGVIYNHPGYEIIGWFTEPDGDGTKYEVGKKYLFDGNPIGDLTIYAIWQAHSYYVEFNANVPSGTSYSGTMEKLQFNYNTKYTLPANEYFYVGFIFLYWKDSDGKTYYDEQDVENLTAVDGKTIILYAQWEICTHTNQEHYHYTGVDNVITKECDCLAFKETATLVTLNTVYNEQVQEAKVIYSNTDWNLSISYEKGGVSAVPQNAGTYTATITYHGVTASDVHFIDKATQVAPSKPTYQVEEHDDVYNTIVVDKVTVSGKTFEYTIEWYEGSELKTLEWDESNTFLLNVAYTNYYVYARYAGDDNHYPSDAVRADAVYYFLGLASIKVICPDSILFTLTQVTTSDSSNGIKIDVSASTNYFLTKDFSVTANTYDESDHLVTEGTFAKVNEVSKRVEYLLISIPSKGEVIITIDGAKLKAVVNTYIEENQVFENITSTDAFISHDSSFTAQFDLHSVEGYTDYAINFSQMLPVNTSIILVDAINNIYYYKNLSVEANKIMFSDLTKLFKYDNSSTSTDLDNLKYRVIVDFSKVTSTSLLNSNLNIWLSASKADISDECLPDFPTAIKEVGVSSISHQFSEFTDDLTTDMTKGFNISYASTSASASKWDNRAPSLIVTPKASLPVDARLMVQEGNFTTVYYLNSEGKFIIPLIDNESSVYITLVSDMFEKEMLEFDFSIDLVASNSGFGLTSSNGTVLKHLENVTFIKAEEKDVALSVETDKTSYSLNETAVVDINYLNVTNNMSVTLTLMLKDEKGEYSSTGWNMTLTEDGIINVPLAGQVAGSYSLTCVIKDESGMTLITVPSYFVITNQSLRPSVTLKVNKESYSINDEIIVSIISNNITDNETVTLSLLILDESNNSYSGTGWQEEIIDQTSVSIVLTNWQSGTYKVLCEVKSQDGKTVTSAEAYFVMNENEANPSV